MAWQSLDEAKAEAMGCQRCRLAKGRTHVVWMDGNPASSLMFVGEAPGYYEDASGLPFVGAAGQLLDETLGSVGLSRNECTICNVLKCRPPSNRDPLPDEIESCKPYLEAQIGFIKPRVIATLGNFATRFVLDRQVSISRVRGQRFSAHGSWVIPTFHPAAILRSGGVGSAMMASFRQDFALIRQTLDLPGDLPPRSAADAAGAAEQQALF